jgi:uncharacterized lipoprotein
MYRNSILSLLITLLITVAPSVIAAQERAMDEVRVSPNAAVSQTIGTTQVSITYGRPGVKERTIFGDIVPYGQVWRTGANESTAITFSKDVTVEGEPIQAGTYSLYTIPEKEEWTIIFNSKLSWGTMYEPQHDIARFTVKPESADKKENLAFYFTDLTDTSAVAVIHWDTLKVPFTIRTD